MKAPTLLQVVLAIIVAIATYVLIINIDPQSAAIVSAAAAFVSALITSVVGSNASYSEDEDSEEYAGDVETTTLYVGNLPYRANEQAVKEHFESHGKVLSVRLMKDRRTGKRKGFGFVEIESAKAEKAIAALNDKDFQERNLKVRLAKEKTA